MNIGGVVSMRAKEIEERQLAIIPGSVSDPCYRCGELIVVTPAMQNIRRREHCEPWCWRLRSCARSFLIRLPARSR